jgi:hypothetical protein
MRGKDERHRKKEIEELHGGRGRNCLKGKFFTS